MSRNLSRYRRHYLVSCCLLIISMGIYLAQQQGWFVRAGQTAEVSQPGLYTIDHFIDGDTIAVDMNGSVEDVRFIGIDTPETHKPDTPVECFGPEAAAHTKSVIEQAGNRVRLGSDPLSTDRDRYGRLLRYVYLPDGTDLNELNVRQGYAFYYPYFPFTKAAAFAADERAAQSAKLGLWKACRPTPSDNGGYKMDESEPSQQT